MICFLILCFASMMYQKFSQSSFSTFHGPLYFSFVFFFWGVSHFPLWVFLFFSNWFVNTMLKG